MKRFLLLLVLLPWLPLPGNSQGTFYLSTRTARTRIGSTNGPLAGPGIWGQALAGFTADSMTPVGFPSEHYTNGLVGGPLDKRDLAGSQSSKGSHNLA